MKTAFISLGCDKNLSDSEHMLYSLGRAGIEITDDEGDADVVIINTCCFIESALQESIDTILSVAQYKKTGHLKGIIVTGCMSSRYEEDIKKDLPEVDMVVSANDYDKIADAVFLVSGVEKPKISASDAKNGRVNVTGGFYDFLKIADGCDKNCTYCIIPSLRGHYRSYPMEELVSEAASMARSGVKELILVAQETTLYGTDIYGKKTLPELIRRLNEIPGINWIRLMYAYPEEITEDLINAMAECEKVCHYIDMPIQHADDRILSLMGRRTRQKELVRKIDMIRSKMPDIAIRTTLISGFPGETDEMHENLMNFLRLEKLDHVGVFTYSREDKTPASVMPDQVPKDIADKRRDDIMRLQQGIVFRKNRSLIGQSFPVMTLGYIPESDCYAGRTMRDAPDVDSLVFFHSSHELLSGDFTDVKITSTADYDLKGETE